MLEELRDLSQKLEDCESIIDEIWLSEPSLEMENHWKNMKNDIKRIRNLAEKRLTIIERRKLNELIEAAR